MVVVVVVVVVVLEGGEAGYLSSYLQWEHLAGKGVFYICSSITFSQMRCVDCGGRNRLLRGCDVNGFEDPCSRRNLV